MVFSNEWILTIVFCMASIASYAVGFMSGVAAR